MLGFSFNVLAGAAQNSPALTYAERLGWSKTDKVVIFHVDDAGMSYDSNDGAIKALNGDVATSVSVMMPCPWVPAMVKYLREHSGTDAGLHLTHTSEWDGYRWVPLTGCKQSPGLCDQGGAMWNNVSDVQRHASADHVEAEIWAQLERAREMGFNPTHLDTHMGTLWSSPEYLDRYIKVGIAAHIPILFAAGHGSLLLKQLQEGPLSGLKKLGDKKEDQKEVDASVLKGIQQTGERIWNAGLAVVDDLYISSYDWVFPKDKEATDENLRQFKTERYKALLQEAKPGITVILIHCTAPTEAFGHITDSGNTRKADLLAMTDPALMQFIRRQGIILTTWRELQARRDKLTAPDFKHN